MQTHLQEGCTTHHHNMDDIYFPGMDTQSNNQTSDIYFPGMEQQTPQDVMQAQQDTGSQADNGECERFVEKEVYGKTGLFPSASAAADYYAQNGQLKSGLDGARPGDLVYFQDPNQPDGHVGILSDNKGNFISATYNGVQTNNLNDWMQQTGQQILGHVSQGGN